MRQGILPLAWCLVTVSSSPPHPPTNGHSMSGAGMGLIVNTTLGLVQGTKHVLNDGIHVRKWLGLPFAKPPIGELRFQTPVPPYSWPGN